MELQELERLIGLLDDLAIMKERANAKAKQVSNKRINEYFTYLRLQHHIKLIEVFITELRYRIMQ